VPVVKIFRKRGIAAWLALACVASLPALRAPLLLAGLALERASGGHSYSLLLAEDASHFDLVVSHGDHGEHEPAGEHGASPSCGQADHVVHLCSDPALRKAERRAEVALALAGFGPSSVRRVEVSTPVPARSHTPSLQAADGLRSVVIRC
jgi:hypothetical protein